ncbi:MAG: ribosome maturation factor RimP [Clostridia bacterium]|nr:ribosome maturation factor RimP [Clostridia bacterium]MBQ7089763.1 ribosome maturation factor RimP [Clostridia bacterium]
MKENIASRVEALASPVAQELGYELFDVEYVKEGPDWFLRLFITKEGGIAIDDCEAMSRAVDPLLDEADIIKDHYYLEVSSVGLDRPLKKEKDFRYFMGEMIEVKLFRPLEGKDLWVGKLTGYEDGNFTVSVEEGTLELNTKDARLIRPWVDFT